ncbi:ABC transporter substrate-binding protein [Mangrovicoccus sp. HB161399]|uniref:ABC transporter substrate-binding protein n=1 Tax=Mangrovicoccus sp. HB161399 TaxID=2720392 RepID=UPI001C1309C1
MKRLLSGTTLALAAATAAQAQEAEVMHWWTSGSEAAALQVFIGAYEAAGGTWTDNAVPDFESAIAAATSAIIGGNPPDALQFNAGTQFADLAQLGYLTDLSPLAEAGGWKAALPAALYGAVSYGGKVYAMPVDNHGENWLWLNRSVMEKAGAELPDSWDGFFPMLDKIKAAGFIPVAHGGEGWQELELFYQIMMFRGDDALYKGIVLDGDTSVLDTPEFTAFAEDFRKLNDYVDPGAPGRKWNDATQMVISGQAAMQFMGDWAKGEFTAAGMEPGKDFDCVLGLGGQDRFVISADVFVLPSGGDNAPAQELLAATMMDPAVQADFNAVKGGLPARLDADVSGLDACAQKGYAAMQTPEFQVAGPEISASADRVGAIQDAVTQYWNTPSETPDDFAAALRDAIAMTAE